MQCNICGEEVANSEDLAKHIERVHPIAESGQAEPDESPEKPDEQDVPKPPAIIPGRV